MVGVGVGGSHVMTVLGRIGYRRAARGEISAGVGVGVGGSPEMTVLGRID